MRAVLHGHDECPIVTGDGQMGRLGSVGGELLEQGQRLLANFRAQQCGIAELDQHRPEFVAYAALARETLQIERGHDPQGGGDGDAEIAGEIRGDEAVGMPAQHLKDAAGVAEIGNHIAL